MGAFQNKVIAVEKAQAGEDVIAQQEMARDRMLAATLALYLSAGGSAAELSRIARIALDDSPPQGTVNGVAPAVGDLMQALALFGYVHDIDIMQAGYNTLDARITLLRQRVGQLRD